MRRLRASTLAAGLLLAVVPAVRSLSPEPAPVRRQPVLAQVRVPHPYYWREMYVPQATSGPGAPTWSPDGRELIYAMQGTLWRQHVETAEARQLTDGPGYDHQPDWSPDGKRVVYVSYRGGAIDLRMLHLESGQDEPLLSNGAVNLDPRWSPDGQRIAFVSTAHQGRWHVYMLGIDERGHASAEPARLTEDRQSELPRYYYSAWDHYLSPTWSPDGRELMLVSNRGRVQGTGGLWRMAAQPAAAMREIHYEETTWKARPDWSPDGRRVVYSSYHGRQWHQLWLIGPDGGDPLPLTYGEHDLTAPRWSRDGRRIACISNERGDTSLVVIDVPGGRQRSVVAVAKRYRSPTAELLIHRFDEQGRAPIPARASVTGPDGRHYAPDEGWRHADEALVPSEQAFEYGYFHFEREARLTVPAGRITVETWAGPEHEVARLELTLAPGDVRGVRVVGKRLADMPARGFRGGDLHVHMNYGGAYRNTPAHLALQARAEGLHVVENLVVNKEQRIPDMAAFRTTPDPVSTPEFVLMHGQEFHTSYWGHLGLLGLREHYILPDYAGYARTALASLAPTNTDVAALAHAQGALVGYVHPFDRTPDPDAPAEARSLPVDAALGTLDYMEVMGYSDHMVTSEVWYRLLNCGLRIPAGAGTDAFPNFASLRGPAGLLRTYVRLGPRLDHDAFLDGLKRGRTFVTNAPLLSLEVEGRHPGDELRLLAGRRLKAAVWMRSAVPVDHVEVVVNGAVAGTVPLSPDRRAAEGTVEVPLARSGWLVLRARADRPHLPVLDMYPFASTSPVYVQVGESTVRSPEDAAYFVRWLDRLAAAAEASTDWNTPAERERALGQIARARERFRAQTGRPRG